MRWSKVSSLFIFVLFLSAFPAFSQSYTVRNPELGIVYRPPSVSWDAQQWNAVFDDSAPPAGWVILPVGKESCGAVNSTWLNNAKSSGFQLAILLAPFLSSADIKKTIDCAVPLGFRRAILDEYVSYQTRNLLRPKCTVLSEVQSIYDYVKGKYPWFSLGIDDNWHIWIKDLARGGSDSCRPYPYFRYDFAGVSVLSKYSNPVNGVCGHPTESEMREQLLDLKQIVKEHSISGKIFVWQLNQHWYPGGSDVLGLFRKVKSVYGWDRYFLWGPTADNVNGSNWGYRTGVVAQACPNSAFQWFLPARDYLIKISQGLKTFISLTVPSAVTRGSSVEVRGNIRTGTGIPVSNLQLQITPPVGTVRSFSKQLVSPSNAYAAMVGLRVNREIPFDVNGVAQFLLQRAQVFQTGTSNNLVSNSDFNDGFTNWLLVSTAPVSIVTAGAERSVAGTSASNQYISLTSLPFLVFPGRSYTIKFDAGIFQEARANGYFFISWRSISTSEVRRDRLFMTFPEPQTIASTSSLSDGSFLFHWTPALTGTYTVGTFFPGTDSYQPSITRRGVAVN